MANPLIMIGKGLSVRPNSIVAVEVSGATVLVYLDTVQTPFRVDMADRDNARSQRNCILAAVHDVEKNDFWAMSGRSSTNALHAEPVKTVSTKNTPDESRLSRVSRIAGLLQQEFGDTLQQVGFQKDLWVALQVIYGPGGAAQFANDCLEPLSRVI